MMSKLSASIPSQLAGNIRENYPRFVEFLTAYYEWLENPDNAYYHVRNHLSHLDFEKSLDSYVDQMKKEYLVNIPESILGNPELFIKYSKQFNLSIGSEKSFNFVFNMLFGEDVELYYPKDDILRVSDGKWIGNESRIYVTNTYDPEQYVNRQIYQETELAPGIFQYAFATVVKAKIRSVGGYTFSELTVTDIGGDLSFDPSLPVYPQNDKTKLEWFMPTGLAYDVVTEGINYRQGDILSLVTSDKNIINRTSPLAGRFDARVTTNFPISEIEVFVNAVQLNEIDFDWDGRYVDSSEIGVGDTVEVRLPIYPGFMIVDNIGGTMGNVKSINIIDPAIGIGSTYTLDASDGGNGAVIEISPATTIAIPGYYRNDDGHLSSTKVLQDGEFYQEFSYVIRSTQDIESYRDVVLSVLHPAGMKLFGEINLKFLIDLMIRDIDFNIDIRPPVFQFVSEPSLGPTTSFFDRQKVNFDEELVKAGNYVDLIMADVIETPLKRWNIADHKRSIVCIDEYVDDGYWDAGYVCAAIDEI